MLIPVNVIIKNNDVSFRVGDDKVVYETEINSFVEESGLTIENPIFPLISDRVYYYKLSDISQTYVCGNGFKTNMLEIKKEKESPVILIIDFEDIEEVSESFLSTYTKFLLDSSDKIITINMNIGISNAFGSYVISNIQEEEE